MGTTGGDGTTGDGDDTTGGDGTTGDGDGTTEGDGTSGDGDGTTGGDSQLQSELDQWTADYPTVMPSCGLRSKTKGTFANGTWKVFVIYYGACASYDVTVDFDLQESEWE